MKKMKKMIIALIAAIVLIGICPAAAKADIHIPVGQRVELELDTVEAYDCVCFSEQCQQQGTNLAFQYQNPPNNWVTTYTFNFRQYPKRVDYSNWLNATHVENQGNLPARCVKAR